MKKAMRVVALVLAMVMATMMFAGCSGTPKNNEETEAAGLWTPGGDSVTVVSEAASTYSPTFTVNLRVVGGNEDVLYDGTVTLTSDTMWTSEFLKAAITDKGLAQDGIDTGFINKLGDYENNSTDSIYWGYTVNGVYAAWGCNQLQLRDGDYVLFTYEKVEF
jgi:hypothetical protein